MEKLSLQEQIIYRFFFTEDRVYKQWYPRFLLCGIDLARIRRVVARIQNYFMWCDEWVKEGEYLKQLAEAAQSQGYINTAKRLFHQAAGCFQVGQHFFFLDIKKKNVAQAKARENYKKAIALYDEAKRPIRIEIPFRDTVIPGYLRLVGQSGLPLIIYINGLDNIKECENHYIGNSLLKTGFNFFAFDGPGQGEMWASMKMIADYERVVSTIIDWFEENNAYKIDLSRIGTYGLSFGGYLAPRATSFDERIACVVGNGGPGYLSLDMVKKVNPLLIRNVLHVSGYKSLEEAAGWFEQVDIKKVPPLTRPLLFFQGGKDKLIPDAKAHAEYIMKWAIGERELKYYPDGEHVCINYLDEVIPYVTDWFTQYLK